MSVFDLFRSKSDREKLSHLKALVALAVSDGKVEKSELAAIAAVCRRDGLTDADLRRCIDNPESISFVAPSDNNTRLMHLRDMVCLMMCDGDIDDTEFSVCKLTAEALGYKPEVIDVIILGIIEELKSQS